MLRRMDLRDERDLREDQLEQYDDAVNESFDDELSFNSWQLSPNLPKPYSELLTKDAVLGNYGKDKYDFNQIESNIAQGILLTKPAYNKLVGYRVFTTDNPDGFSVPLTDLKKVFELFPRQQIVRVVPELVNKPVFEKSTHNFFTRGYTKMVLTRGIGGKASRELKIKYAERKHTLEDQTQRSGFFGFFKKRNNAYANEQY